MEIRLLCEAKKGTYWGRFTQNLQKSFLNFSIFLLLIDFQYDFLMILRPEADHINLLNLWGRFAQNLSKIYF